MENERKEQPSRFVKVHEVMEICDCSESHAYRIMKQLNDELKKRGFISRPRWESSGFYSCQGWGDEGQAPGKGCGPG